MQLINTTGMQAGYTLGMRPDGGQSLLVVVKGTFTLPTTEKEIPRLLESQEGLVAADTFLGEPGFSAPVYESDYAPYKPRCDIILNGSAYAPQGNPVTQVTVKLQVGRFYKSFNVIGDRVWQVSWLSRGVSKPLPFTVMPINYQRAFGGTDNSHLDESKHRAYMPNPVGCGYHHFLKKEWMDNTPLPNTEEIGQRVTKPDGQYRPMAFGVVGRNWEPRFRLAGTYDQAWQDNVFPFLPQDFKEAYYQCAHLDQLVDHLRGGERVWLENLTPQGRLGFQVPQVPMSVVFFRKKGGQHKMSAVLDTLILEPDAKRFILIWRASLPLKKNMFEISQVTVGKQPPAPPLFQSGAEQIVEESE